MALALSISWWPYFVFIYKLVSYHMSDNTTSQEAETQTSATDASNEEQKNVPAATAKQSDHFQVNKKGFIETEGEVEELLPGLKFKVVLDNEHEITATLAGRMRMNRIMLIAGDRVRVEMSPYDLTKGRITYRF